MRTAEKTDLLVPLADRSAQRFPRLRPEQMDIVKRYAKVAPKMFSPGEPVFEVDDPGVPTWFLLEGSAMLIGRDGYGGEAVLTELQTGDFSGELHQIVGSQSLTRVRAGKTGCVAVPLDADRLRALIVGSAELGEVLVRAMILRRVGLMERGLGPILLGRAGSAGLNRLQNFLGRSAYPYLVLDCTTPRGRQLMDDLELPPEDYPLLVSTCGRVLRRPSNEEAAAWLGITPTLNTSTIYDVVVVGSGPAGLATAVYAASEGLSVLVLDSEVVGGQAGASARIENYLGFPTGISGRALTGRALTQAQKFGAEVAIPLVATKLNCSALSQGRPMEVEVSDHGTVKARTVVVASGARYKKPDIERLAAYEGYTVHYWASQVEAALCEDKKVVLIGAGNSAGQGAIFLASHAKRITIVVRGQGLEASMSRYLIDRIESLANVEVLVQSEVISLNGDASANLNSVTLKNRATGELSDIAASQVFLFIGAEPNTAWLGGCVDLDEKGYILTGDRVSAEAGSTPTSGLQTSLPNVFAIGDVRAGSTKRIASAVGEGAAVVSQIHTMLTAPIA